MADFNKAYKRTCEHEGGWANKINDRGGMTWKGIARNYHPKWEGWKIIDQYRQKCKDVNSLNKALFADKELEKMVVSFYKKNFWNANKLDLIEDQLLAENIFDASVNCGVAMGAKFLQRAINRVKPGTLVVDGVIGQKTIVAANALGAKLVDPYIDIRIEYHKNIVKSDTTQRSHLKGWLNRCEAMRKRV